MDFSCIVLFLAMYYLKPQEWTSAFESIRFVQLTMLASITTLIFRERSLKLDDFFRTPHDWAMFAFFVWIVVASPTPVDTFKEMSNRLVFYVVVIHTLTNWLRLRKFLGWWTAFIVIIAALALMGEFKMFDPLGSYDITHGRMKERLVLNLSMVNNPNALGHALVPAIPMLYYFCIWKRPLFMKQIGCVALILPLYALFLTQSKGGYLAAVVATMATLTFGRPKTVQIIIGITFVAVASSAIYLLPRMTELNKAQADEAIQGRIQSSIHGQEYYHSLPYGVGQGNFVKVQFEQHNFKKAAHSTFVQTGAELGKTGMFLFLLILWCCLRTLMFAKTQTPEQERVRRLLFVLVISFVVSGWMVDFAYRATFFMFVAAVGAFHRHLHGLMEIKPDAEPVKSKSLSPAWSARMLPMPSVAGVPAAVAMQIEAAPDAVLSPKLASRSMPWLGRSPEPAPEQAAAKPKFWNRLTLLDVVVTLVLLELTGRFWIYTIEQFGG